jgi:hypothetical protein
MQENSPSPLGFILHAPHDGTALQPDERLYGYLKKARQFVGKIKAA